MFSRNHLKLLPELVVDTHANQTTEEFDTPGADGIAARHRNKKDACVAVARLRLLAEAERIADRQLLPQKQQAHD